MRDAPPAPRDLAAVAAAFGARLAVQRPPLCPELALWLTHGDVDLEAGCFALVDGEAPPYWAFCWGAGQVLARHLLDHPELVAGRRVVDVGAGSGIVAIAAARAGALSVHALDVDVVARRAALENARLNEVSIEATATLPDAFDFVLAADVLYETGLRDWILGDLARRAPGLLADPQRAGAPRLDLPVLARIDGRTFPDVDSPQTSVVLHRLPHPEPERLS